MNERDLLVRDVEHAHRLKALARGFCEAVREAVHDGLRVNVETSDGIGAEVLEVRVFRELGG